MFHRETTDIHPRFGKTLDEVLQSLEGYEIYSQASESSVGNGGSHFHFRSLIVSANPYAVKVLEQRPFLIHYPTLYENQNAIDLIADHLSRQGETERRIPFAKLFQNTSCYLDTLLVNIMLEFNPEESLFKYLASGNPRVIPYLRKHPEYIDWQRLSMCSTDDALDLLESNPDKVAYDQLCFNRHPRAMELLRTKPELIHWKWLATNPCEDAARLLLENIDTLRLQGAWDWLASNKCPLIVNYLAENLDQFTPESWYQLNSNPTALPILQQHPDQVLVHTLIQHATTQEQVDFLMEHKNYFIAQGKTTEEKFWINLSANRAPAVSQLFQRHPDKIISWLCALSHQDVFETTTVYDYAGIRAARRELHEEYHAWAGHPVRVQQKARDWKLEDFMEAECL